LHKFAHGAVTNSTGFMNILLKALQLIYWTYAAILFVVFMLMAFPFVVIASFFGKIKGGNIIYKICRLWDDVWMFVVGIHHTNIYESPVNPSRPYIFVANHVSYMDIPIILKTVRREPIRVLGKSEMKKVPIFGFIYSRAVVMVDRNNAANRSKSVRISKSVLRKGISIFIYPEGTFNETGYPLKDFYDGAFRIAIETQTTIKPVLFLDSYDRMNSKSFFSLNPGRSRSVFLEDVDVTGLSLKDVPLLKKKVYEQMERKLIIYKASWITGKS
jgi:1-acyl-sn-glycerol-3-phosphate acyltransferase